MCVHAFFLRRLARVDALWWVGLCNLPLALAPPRIWPYLVLFCYILRLRLLHMFEVANDCKFGWQWNILLLDIAIFLILINFFLLTLQHLISRLRWSLIGCDAFSTGRFSSACRRWLRRLGMWWTSMRFGMFWGLSCLEAKHRGNSSKTANWFVLNGQALRLLTDPWIIEMRFDRARRNNTDFLWWLHSRTLVP